MATARALPAQVVACVDHFLHALEARFRQSLKEPRLPRHFSVDPDEVEAFRGQIEQKSYALADSTATIKTRGSAQKAFAGAAMVNHECRCTINGIATKDFLVTPHTVPWSEDQGVRLDLSNGIRLSLLVDRAFEKGHVLINDGLANRIDWGRVGNDHVLRGQLAPCDGHTLSAPAKGARLPEYLQRHLQRRRARAATFA